jgi:tetratricopeptide (TPR) repeat protein
VLAWLGVMERDARLYARGLDTARNLHAPGSFARAEADLKGARLLNPDSAPDYARAVVYRGGGRPAQAIALLDEIVRREPDNLAAWGALYALARDDPATARRALDARRRLDPVNARRR